ncbi:MAG: signal peptide peptidase SppA [Verrucomicrobiota bacterium JB023]|nr:signal peptide peptidase SppA [Verrucomicrobiota bacterium JB023]
MMKMTCLSVAMAAGTLLAEPVIPVYDLAGMLTESGNVPSGLFEFDTNPHRPLTHFDVVRSLEKAAADEEIPAVVLEVDQAAISLAQLEEIRRGLLDIREAGKEVWLYTDSLNSQTALLGSAATHLTLNPEGDVSLSGLFAESMYFKGLLDKAGIVADVVHIGDFKSAGENFYRTGPSKAAEKQSQELFDSIHNTLLTEIAVGRGITRDSLASLVDQGFVTAEEAKAKNLVDRLQYRTDFVNELQDLYSNLEFKPDYARGESSEPEIDSMLDLMKLMFSSGEKSSPEEEYVAVVALDAGITFESISPVRDEILAATDDEMCRALVLRVNSPGGSALASEILWEATEEFSRTGRPFLVSMGAVAASGGYYVSSAADEIFAEPATITGSIGVVGMKLAMGGALEKLGITTHEMKRGDHADIYNSTRPFTKQERTIIRNSMLDVYRTFKQRILDGRGHKLAKDLEKLAGGRVYTGSDALRLGLVDELGGLNEAIARAVELSDIDSPRAILLPEPTSPLDNLFNQEPEKSSDEFISMQTRTDSLNIESLLTINPLLQSLPETKARQIREALATLRSFEAERVQLIAPPIPTY